MAGPLNRLFLIGKLLAIDFTPNVVRMTLETVDRWKDKEGHAREKRQIFRATVVHLPTRTYLGTGAVRVGDELLVEGQLESFGSEGREVLSIILGGLHSSVQLTRRADQRAAEEV